MFNTLATSPWEDNNTFLQMCYEIGEHIGMDLTQFLMDCPLQFKPQVLNGFQVRRLRLPLQNYDFVAN